MVQLLFLAARTNLKARYALDALSDFHEATRLPYNGLHLCNDFVFWVFDYSFGPIKFQRDYLAEMNGGLFLDYGIGQIIGTPFVREDMVPTKRSWWETEILRGYEDQLFENPEWSEYLKRLANNYAVRQTQPSWSRAKLLFVEMRGDEMMESREVRDLKRRMGGKAKYHFHTDHSFIASLSYGASPEALCRSLGHVLASDSVADFAGFEIGSEYVSGPTSLNTLGHWLSTQRKQPRREPIIVDAKQEVVVERVQRHRQRKST